MSINAPNVPAVVVDQSNVNQANEAFNQVLRAMLSVSGMVSDLIFSPGRPPQLELMGQLRGVKLQGLEMITPVHTKSISDLLIGNNQAARDKLEKFGSADVSYSVG